MGLCVLLLGSAWYLGYSFEHSRFTKFKDEVRATAEKQIAQNEAKIKEQEIINRSKDAEYKANLSNVSNFYQRMLDNPSSSPVSIIPNATSLADAKAQYIQLASSCAATTTQVIALQDWINEQLTLK
jgi:hypothetical protein